VELFDGVPYLVIDFGDGVHRFMLGRDALRVNDGSTHHVKVERSRKTLNLTLDDDEKSENIYGHTSLDLGNTVVRLLLYYISDLQHKGAMSTKPVFEKIAKIQRSYVPLCGHTTVVLLTPARFMTFIDKIAIFCNDLNKTSTFVELLAINILRYMS